MLHFEGPALVPSCALLLRDSLPRTEPKRTWPDCWGFSVPEAMAREVAKGGEGIEMREEAEEVADLDALVALELDDLPHLLVVDEGAVAGEFLWRLLSASCP